MIYTLFAGLWRKPFLLHQGLISSTELLLAHPVHDIHGCAVIERHATVTGVIGFLPLLLFSAIDRFSQYAGTKSFFQRHAGP